MRNILVSIIFVGLLFGYQGQILAEDKDAPDVVLSENCPSGTIECDCGLTSKCCGSDLKCVCMDEGLPMCYTIEVTSKRDSSDGIISPQEQSTKTNDSPNSVSSGNCPSGASECDCGFKGILSVNQSAPSSMIPSCLTRWR